MQIKSWQIALTGSILNVLFLLNGLCRTNFSSTQGIFYEFSIISIIGIIIIPVIFLKSHYSVLRKIGAAVSILFGLVFLFGSGVSILIDDTFFPMGVVILFFPGISFLIAGIYYFWKKV